MKAHDQASALPLAPSLAVLLFLVAKTVSKTIAGSFKYHEKLEPLAFSVHSLVLQRAPTTHTEIFQNPLIKYLNCRLDPGA